MMDSGIQKVIQKETLFFIDGDEVYFYEINDYENREVSFIKSEYKGELKKDKVEFYSCSYDYTSDDDYKTKKIDKTIYLTRLSNVEFKVNGKTYNRASKQKKLDPKTKFT